VKKSSWLAIGSTVVFFIWVFNCGDLYIQDYTSFSFCMVIAIVWVGSGIGVFLMYLKEDKEKAKSH